MNTTIRRDIAIDDFLPRRAGSLHGFVKITLPGSMILSNVGIHVASGKCWASPPTRPFVGRTGVVMRGTDGKIRYAAVVSFTSKEVRDRWSDVVVEAVHTAYPDALAGDTR